MTQCLQSCYKQIGESNGESEGWSRPPFEVSQSSSRIYKLKLRIMAFLHLSITNHQRSNQHAVLPSANQIIVGPNLKPFEQSVGQCGCFGNTLSGFHYFHECLGSAELIGSIGEQRLTTDFAFRWDGSLFHFESLLHQISSEKGYSLLDQLLMQHICEHPKIFTFPEYTKFLPFSYLTRTSQTC